MRVNRERGTVLIRPLVLIDNRRLYAVLFEEQSRDKTHRAGADDEDLRIGVTGH